MAVSELASTKDEQEKEEEGSTDGAIGFRWSFSGKGLTSESAISSDEPTS
jgi:hypothetical protein